jgi:hypothetical protein
MGAGGGRGDGFTRGEAGMEGEGGDPVDREGGWVDLVSFLLFELSVCPLSLLAPVNFHLFLSICSPSLVS